LFELGHVRVAITQAFRLAEAYAVDDAGVVQFVSEDGVALIEKRLEQTAVGVEAGGIENGIVFPQKARDVAFQLLVQLLRATDETDRSQAIAIAAQAFVRRFYDGRMVGESQVIVRTEIDNLAVTDANGRALRALEQAFTFVESTGTQVFKLGF